jgi:hypothetical protein
MGGRGGVNGGFPTSYRKGLVFLFSNPKIHQHNKKPTPKTAINSSETTPSPRSEERRVGKECIQRW